VSYCGCFPNSGAAKKEKYRKNVNSPIDLKGEMLFEESNGLSQSTALKINGSNKEPQSLNLYTPKTPSVELTP
jgi:hypothetical protein